MPDPVDPKVQLLEKPAALKRMGCALIVVALVLLMIITTSAVLYSPLVALYSYALLGAGFILVMVNKVLEGRLKRQLADARVYCLRCGWGGRGTEWFRSECCPECDGEEVIEV